MRIAAGLGRLRLVLVILVSGFVFLDLMGASASSANISRAYKPQGTITNGSLVSLSKRSDFIELANVDNASRLLGVAVANKDSLVALDAEDGLVQVATSGTASVLVSNIGGDIKVGDSISVSPFNGVGMKATAGARNIGIAQTVFDAKTDGTNTANVTDKTGTRQQVRVGYIRLTISSSLADTKNGDSQSNSLQKLTKSLTGHSVSTTRVIIGLVIVALALVALITLIYAAIYGSIISVGRNPLGAPAVYRTLRTVMVMAGLTAAMAGMTVFLLLR